MSAPKPPFEKLYFGKSDPRYEVRASRDHFLRSFVDLEGAVEKVHAGDLTLILGPKGTGKSALALYLEETSGPESRRFAKVKTAENLPLDEIPKLETGQSSGVQRTRTAWTFILLANYLDVVLEDKLTSFRGITAAKGAMKAIRQAGFVSTAAGQRLMQMQDVRMSIPAADLGGAFKKESHKEIGIFTLIPYMLEWATAAESVNRHILLLDGLDSVFLNDSRYDDSLAGLTEASTDINNHLSAAGSTGSIVPLLRNDIFSRVSLLYPDAHKMRDFALDLDWRVLSGQAGERGPLWNLINSKARLAFPDAQSVRILEYFPREIRQPRGRSIDRLQYLLNLTRHTPRDLLQLMEYIRLAHVQAGAPSGPLSPDVIREGVLQYSTKYFVDAVKGEFAGYRGGAEEVSAALHALKVLPGRTFSRTDYYNALRRSSPGLQEKCEEFLRMLFFAGALGNQFGTGGKRYLVFYHRRDDTSLSLQGTLILHNALAHAWSK